MNGLPAIWWAMATCWGVGLAGDAILALRGRTEARAMFSRFWRTAYSGVPPTW